MELRTDDQSHINLYFVRHGEYVDLTAANGSPDADNPLSDIGIANLRHEAETLTAWQLPFDTLLSSPFLRARQTADILSDVLNIPVLEEVLLTRTEFGVEQLGKILAKYPAARHLLLVGHEPDFSTVVAAITGGAIQLQRGGVAKVSLISQNPWQAELVWLVTPQIWRPRYC